MKSTRLAAALCATALAAAGLLSAQGRGGAPAREIVQIRGDLYFVRGGSHNTVFLVTPDGIILGDPISTDIANWLKPDHIEAAFINLRDYK